MAGHFTCPLAFHLGIKSKDNANCGLYYDVKEKTPINGEKHPEIDPQDLTK